MHLFYQCFSAEDIFKEIEEGEEEGHNHTEDEHSHEEKVLDQHDFEKACASIILHLVKGYCIKEGHGHNETKPNLPSKEFFIKELFNGKKYLSEKDLESIAESLGIGKKSSESTASSSSDSHDHGHDHRRRRSAEVSAVLPQKNLAESHSVHRRAVDPHDHAHGGNGTVSIRGCPHLVPGNQCLATGTKWCCVHTLSTRYVTSGGSRGGARGAPLFSDQT